MGTLPSFVVDVARQRGLVAAVMATAWDTCCCRPTAAHDSVGCLLLFAVKINSGRRSACELAARELPATNGRTTALTAERQGLGEDVGGDAAGRRVKAAREL